MGGKKIKAGIEAGGVKDIYPSRETLLKILDAMFDELYVLDANNTCIYVNKACERHYNQSPEDLIGRTLLDSVHSGYWSPGIGVIAANEKQTATFEMMSNTNKKLVVTATPVLDEHGRVSMIVENIRDVQLLMKETADIETSQRLFSKYYTYENPPELKSNVSSLVAESRVMKEILEIARRAAKSKANILLSGNTGSGKSLLARFIHDSGPGSGGPFITINCSAIPEQLFESELFGYVAGAFSGASAKGKKGIVELAGSGTLFLDEVNSIPYNLQSKILHFLQERTYAPVGGSKLQHSKCRILAASNQDLPGLVDSGGFRADLYYRLSVLDIKVPDLADRRDDIVGLVKMFLKKCNARMNTDCRMTDDALMYLKDRSWPGNVRELENCVERLTALSDGATLDRETLKRFMPPHLLRGQERATEGRDRADGPAEELNIENQSLDETLEHVESRLVKKAWRQGSSSYQVAKLLKISQNRAYRLLKKHVY